MNALRRRTVASGFFAYPSDPPSLGDTVRQGIARINRAADLTIAPWEDCKTGGKVILSAITQAIDSADLFCADITFLNPNVMFELGYAIGRDRRLWLVLDPSIQDSRNNWKRLGLLATVGYSSYCNSIDIENEFYRQSPHLDLQPGFFTRELKPALDPSSESSLLFLKNAHDTEANIRLSRALRDSGIPVTTDDPSESSGQGLHWYSNKTYKSLGVLCHLLRNDRENTLLQNCRYALIAGMAHALGKPLLMIAERPFQAPIDYHDLLCIYDTASDALERSQSWIDAREGEWRRLARDRDTYKERVRLAAELGSVDWGEYIAENEEVGLVGQYFVETASFQQALAGHHMTFVGRKGVGKTATLFKLASRLREDPRVLVTVIKPIAYELGSVLQTIGELERQDQKSYVVEVLWKYLLLTEISRSLFVEIRDRQSAFVGRDEEPFMQLVEENAELVLDEFAVRLESAAALISSVGGASGTREFREGVSEALHRSLLGRIERSLRAALAAKQRVAVLIDNLDKAWDRRGRLSETAEVYLGLLGSASRLRAEFARSAGLRRPIELSLAIFMRSDIFDWVRGFAREPDKISSHTIRWDDQELLLRVPEERFLASRGQDSSPQEMWDRFFCTQVFGIPIRQYLVNQCLARPRDIMFLLKNAVAIALNRRHPRVEQADILAAEEEYSRWVFEMIQVEDNALGERFETLLYDLVGGPSVLTRSQVEARYLACGIPRSEFEATTNELCLLTFLGVEIAADSFAYAEDLQTHRRNLRLAEEHAQRSGREPRFRIHPAFWRFMGISPSPRLAELTP
jgi:hypothetical protein